ncbi:MAG TPA: FAD-binding oxidoreductase [Acidimicrobiales bacterium]|nr:FAD-binding oxidoreductase [Acidimicrobiales bacterium]
MTEPTPPIEISTRDSSGVGDQLKAPKIPVDDRLLRKLRDVCAEVDTDDDSRAEAGRDWWPLSIKWALEGDVPGRPAVVARPRDAAQAAAVVAACAEHRVPVTAAAGRSGVCGASVPAFGGVAMDMCGLAGVLDIDTHSLVTDVLPGTFGPDLETKLRSAGVTLGHWPQSMDLSTVGGWLACRGAGQYSTRYGKIEDMVVGLDVVLANGRRVRTGGAPRAATGPDLTQMFVGSEGTLGVITSARLRLHRMPEAEDRRAFAFSTFTEGLEVCRRVLQRGATPAVLRLYDEVESGRNFDVTGRCVLIVLDEADATILQATMSVVDDESKEGGAEELDVALVSHWMEHRNDVSALAPLYRAGIVVDTIEIAARWLALPRIYSECLAALEEVAGTIAASAHQSHAYVDGACLYFTFAGRSPEVDSDEADRWAESYYVRAWDVVTQIVERAAGSISHHHGVGINRSRFMAGAFGNAFDVLVSLKQALDPKGILNPGKLGLPSPFGEIHWPAQPGLGLS